MTGRGEEETRLNLRKCKPLSFLSAVKFLHRFSKQNVCSVIYIKKRAYTQLSQDGHHWDQPQLSVVEVSGL